LSKPSVSKKTSWSYVHVAALALVAIAVATGYLVWHAKVFHRPHHIPNENAPGYVQQNNHGSIHNHHLTQWVQGTFGAQQTWSLYDIGGGTGGLFSLLQPIAKGINYRCVDVVASEKCTKFDGENPPPLKDLQKVDVVAFNYVLHHAGDQTLPLLRNAVPLTKGFMVVQEDLKGATQLQARHNYNHEWAGTFRGDREWKLLFDVAGLDVVSSSFYEPDNDADVKRAFYVLKPRLGA